MSCGEKGLQTTKSTIEKLSIEAVTGHFSQTYCKPNKHRNNLYTLFLLNTCEGHSLLL